jgi:hypothetical protein
MMMASRQDPDRDSAPSRRAEGTAFRGGIILFASSVAIGVCLRAIQYFASTSLWLDELALANALAPYTLADLVSRPLDFAQIAPIGYVWIEKLLLLVWGPSELALRLPSFVLGCAAIPLAWLLADRILPRAYAWTVSLSVALAPVLIWQSAQVKPYSGDVALSLLMLWLALLDFERKASRPSPALVVAGLLAPWFSLPSLFVVAAISLAWIVRASGGHQRMDYARTALAICCWGATCVVTQAVVRRQVDAATWHFMHGFWANGLPPPSSGIRSVALWLLDALTNMVRALTGDRGGRPLVALAFAGLWGISRSSPEKAVALGMPIVFALCAAALAQYPLTERASLWTAPILLVASLSGAVFATRVFLGSHRTWAAGIVPCAVATAAAIATAHNFPVIQRRQDVKPVLRHIASNAQPGDALYVPFEAWQAATFYRSMLENLSIAIVEGTCSSTDRLQPLAEIDRLRDRRRIWVLFSFLSPKRYESELILGYLDAIGTQRDALWVPGPPPGGPMTSSAVLYELDSDKMARIRDASQWAVPDAVANAPMRICWPVFAPPRLTTRPDPPR